MSEVKLSVSMDVSQAEAAAAALPDSIDRKLRSKKRGDFTQGYTDISAKGTKFIDPKDAMGRTANDLKMAQEAEKKKQQAIDETSTDSKKWIKDFGSNLEGVIMGSIGPAAIAIKAIEYGWGSVVDRVNLLYNNYQSKITAGVSPAEVEAFQMFTRVGTTTEEQAASMAARAQAVANANAAGGQGSNYKAFEYFGMTDYKRYREEGLPLAELVLEMTKRFKKEGGSAQYEMAAKGILGDDWHTMRGMLAQAARFEKHPSQIYDSMSEGSLNQQKARAQIFHWQAMTMSQKDLMGGVGGGLPQLLNGVTSLQAMGGGDVLSALARGPQDRTAIATESSANSLLKLVAVEDAKLGQKSPAYLR